MSRRRPKGLHRPKFTAPGPVAYERSDTLRIEGKLPLVVGRQFRVIGERGRFTFLQATTNVRTGDTWIDCTRSNKDRRSIRSFSPDRVRSVDRKVSSR